MLVVPKAEVLEANVVGEFIFVLLERKFGEILVVRCVSSLVATVYGKEVGFPLFALLAKSTGFKFFHMTTFVCFRLCWLPHLIE
jgi:hypothetical protein